MKLKDLIQHNIDNEQCLKNLEDIERHHNYFRDAFFIEPDIVSIGHLGIIIKVGGAMFKPWLKMFGRRWYWYIVCCQNCGKMVRRWPPFINLKGMKKALTAIEKDEGYRFLCLLCTLPTKIIHEKVRRYHQGRLVSKEYSLFRLPFPWLRKYRSIVGFLDLVTFGGKYWPFGIVIEGARVKKQTVEELRGELIGHSIQEISYMCGKYTIILDDDTELELSTHDVYNLRMRE